MGTESCLFFCCEYIELQVLGQGSLAKKTIETGNGIKI